MLDRKSLTAAFGDLFRSATACETGDDARVYQAIELYTIMRLVEDNWPGKISATELEYGPKLAMLYAVKNHLENMAEGPDGKEPALDDILFRFDTYEPVTRHLRSFEGDVDSYTMKNLLDEGEELYETALADAKLQRLGYLGDASISDEDWVRGESSPEKALDAYFRIYKARMHTIDACAINLIEDRLRQAVSLFYKIVVEQNNMKEESSVDVLGGLGE